MKNVNDLAESIAFESKRSLQNQRPFRRRAGYLWMALGACAITAGIVAFWLRYVN